MTVNNTILKSPIYLGSNGASSQFSFGFKIDIESEISVFETDSDGQESLLVLNVDYSVAIVDPSNGEGGVVTRLGGVLPNNHKLVILSNIEPSQLTAFSSQGGFFPDVHESAFDKLTRLVLQNTEKLTRAFVRSPFSTVLDLVFPPLEAGKLLGVNEAGDNLEFIENDRLVINVYESIDIDSNMILNPVKGFILSTAVGNSNTIRVSFEKALFAPVNASTSHVLINNFDQQLTSTPGTFVPNSGTTEQWFDLYIYLLDDNSFEHDLEIQTQQPTVPSNATHVLKYGICYGFLSDNQLFSLGDHMTQIDNRVYFNESFSSNQFTDGLTAAVGTNLIIDRTEDYGNMLPLNAKAMKAWISIEPNGNPSAAFVAVTRSQVQLGSNVGLSGNQFRGSIVGAYAEPFNFPLVDVSTGLFSRQVNYKFSAVVGTSGQQYVHRLAPEYVEIT